MKLKNSKNKTKTKSNYMKIFYFSLVLTLKRPAHSLYYYMNIIARIIYGDADVLGFI